jgi:hypothetical protein
MVYFDDIRSQFRIQLNQNFIRYCVEEYLAAANNEQTEINENEIAKLTTQIESEISSRFIKNYVVRFEDILYACMSQYSW